MNFPVAIFSGGPGEIVIILGILLLLFGSSKLPKLARSLGSSVTEFRKGIRGEGDESKKKVEDGDPPYLAPSFPEGAQIVYAPDFFKGRTPLLRLSFGMETRMEASAAALSAALSRLAEGGVG